MKFGKSTVILTLSSLFGIVLPSAGCGSSSGGSGGGGGLTSLPGTIIHPFSSGSSGSTGSSGSSGSSSDTALNLFRAGTAFFQAATLSYANEPGMGQSVAAVVIDHYGLVNNPKLTRYVSLVGLTVASASPEPGANWCFGILNTDEVNAFSGPDGYVLITRGAIERMRDESELAGVLGHEISHVVNHDGLNAAKNQGMLKAGLSAAGTNQHFGQFEQLTNGAVDEIITKGYDRKQEDAADAGAVVLVSLAGYDPNGYLHFIQRLAALDKDRSLSIMRTHPGLGDRVNNISKKIAEIKAGGGQTLAARFAANTK